MRRYLSWVLNQSKGIVWASLPADTAIIPDDRAITFLRSVIRTQSRDSNEQAADAINKTIDNAMIARWTQIVKIKIDK